MIAVILATLTVVTGVLALVGFFAGCFTARECWPPPSNGTGIATLGTNPGVGLGKVLVPGNSNRGVAFQAPIAGVVSFNYESGAYSVYPLGEEPEGVETWLTSVFVYRGDRAAWVGETISDGAAVLRLFGGQYSPTADEAATAATGRSSDLAVEQGEIFTLIAVDHQNAYSDNVGAVELRIEVISR